MKRTVTQILAILIFAVFFVSCDDDNEDLQKTGKNGQPIGITYDNTNVYFFESDNHELLSISELVDKFEDNKSASNYLRYQVFDKNSELSESGMICRKNVTNNQTTEEYDELKYIPSQYAGLPVVGGWYGTQDGSYEEFIASEPDMVIESIDEGEDGDLATVQERQDKFGEILINGEKLLSLMIDFGSGVSTKNTYEVKKIDIDYFSFE